VKRELTQAQIFGLEPVPEDDRFGYDDHTWREIERMARLALPHGSILKKAPLPEDLGGIDAHYVVNHRCPLQLRTRFDQPHYSPDKDVTWRVTEPKMIDAGTYAPLALFLWFKDGYAEAGKLIDVYRMAANIDPPLGERPINGSRRNGLFHTVDVPELHATGALLMLGGRDRWAPARLGGERDTVRILEKWEPCA
jgi:hypothetical protein